MQTPRFNWEVNLGHVLQLFGMICMVGGFLIMNERRFSRIESQQELFNYRLTRIEDVARQISDNQTKLTRLMEIETKRP